MKNRWILDGVIFTFIVVAVIASVGITMPPNQDATNQSLYNEISQLQSQINSLQAQSSSQKTQQLTYPLDINSEQVLSDSLNNILPSKMMDLIWRKMIWYTTFFQENVGGTNSGYAVTLTGSGSISNDHNNLALATGATNPSSVEVTKNPEWQGMLTFSQPSYFRTTVAIGPVTNQIAYYVVGSLSGNYYGFKIVNSSLYGVESNNGTANEQTILLQSITASTAYNLEARYLPRKLVSFWINDKSVSSLSSALPSPDPTVNTNLLDIKISTSDTTSKTLQTSFFEYIQARNVLNY